MVTFDTTEKLVDLNSREFMFDEEFPGSEAQEEWLDPLTLKPSKTQTGIGLASLADPPRHPNMPTAVPSQYEAFGPSTSKLSSLLGTSEYMNEAVDESAEVDEPPIDWSFLPSWYTAYWGNVGWIIPQGFEIDTQAMFRQNGLLEGSGVSRKTAFIVLKIRDPATALLPSQTPVSDFYALWKDKINSFFEFMGAQRVLFSAFETRFRLARYFTPAYLNVAFQRQDACISPYNESDRALIKSMDVDGLLTDLAHDMGLGVVLNASSDWIRTRTSVLAPLMGFIYTTGPGFENGERKGLVTRLEEYQDTTVMREIQLGFTNPGVVAQASQTAAGAIVKTLPLERIAERWDMLSEAVQTLIMNSLSESDRVKLEALIDARQT